MTTYHELLTTEREVFACVTEFLNQHIEKDANWNSNRESVICEILHKQLIEVNELTTSSIDTWFSLTCVLKAHTEENIALCRSLFPQIHLDKARCHCMRYVLATLLLLLSANKHIKPSRQINLVISPDLSKSKLFHSLPIATKLFFLISTPTTYQLSTELGLIPDKPRLYLAEKHSDMTGQYKSWAGCTATFRRFIFHENISSFEEISAKGLATYLESDRTRSFSYFLGLVECLSSKDLTNFNKKSQYRETSNSSESTDLFKSYDAKDSKNLCGIDGHLVFRKLDDQPAITIGSWSELKGNLGQFNPHILNREHQNYWLATQIDYLNSRRFEKKTMEIKTRCLSILNMYLFSYLPHFFKAAKPSYPYPEKISDFHGFIYVSRSLTLIRHFVEKRDLSLNGFRYPITLLEFISLFRTDEDSEVNDNSQNAIREDKAEIQRYFDWIISKYSSIEECHLVSNPITKFDRTEGGSKSSKSNKTKLEYEYWLLFVEYLHETSAALLNAAEKFSTASDSYVAVNKTISITGHDLVLGNVKIPFGKQTLVNENGIATRSLQYQQYCALSFMSTGGLRLSNVMWLDTRSFDKYVKADADTHDIVDVFVNTDKSKDHPFNGAVQARTMWLARRCAAMRKFLKNVQQKAIAYQGNSLSKNGLIQPVFQYSPKNDYSNIQKMLPKILEDFENSLTNSKIEFESQLQLCPTHVSLAELAIAKRDHLCIESPYYISDSSDGIKVPFTPLRLKSSVTPHSLRKTFDSFWAVLSNPALVGEIFTGQTEAVVGFYQDNTPSDELAIKNLAKKLNLPSSPIGKILGVNLFQRNEAALISTLRKHGLINEGAFTLSGRQAVQDLEKLFRETPDDQISVHRTHICIYGDTCPKHVLAFIKEKNCGICFIAISLKRDGPAIAAKIRYLSDKILECIALLDSGRLNKAERTEQLNLRSKLTLEVSGWIARHEQIRKLTLENDIVILSEGKDEIIKRLKYVPPGSVAHYLFNRLQEVENLPSMQSARLQRMAERISRGLLPIIKDKALVIPDLPAVESALFLIKKIAEINNLDELQISNLLNGLDSSPYNNSLIPSLNIQ